MKKISMALHGGKVLKEKFGSCDVGIVAKEKKNGCLGIRRLETLNKALPGKWFKRFVMGNNFLWNHVIVSKYRAVQGG